MAAEDFDLSFDDAFAGDSGPADAPAEEASPRSPPLSAAPERLLPTAVKQLAQLSAASGGGGGGDDDVPTTLPSGQSPGPSRPGTKYPVRGQSLTSM